MPSPGVHLKVMFKFKARAKLEMSSLTMVVHGAQPQYALIFFLLFGVGLVEVAIMI